ncbi:MAG TPA: FAD-dependent oxidoreductase, partial [Desulfatiglandales bacterium]|nr:FAD-dependent oxidoreductase [Desulfatiglandales bacterium]
MKYPHLFSPIKINSLFLKNRIVMTAMHLGYTPGGQVTDRLVEFYALRAKGGVGLIIVGGCTIDPWAGMADMISIKDDSFLPGLERLTRAVKAGGAKIGAQLYQAGRYAHSSMIGGKKPFSASAVRSKFTGETPRALDLDEIPEVQDRFAEAAFRAKKVGFDAVEILGSAGYLISQFFSPLTNLRQDQYGGSFENRMRFGIEVVEKVRNAVGASYPIFMRLAGNDFMQGSNTNKEAQIFASELEKAGVDCFNITGGWHETRVPQLTMHVPRKAYAYLAQGIRSAVSVPVIASNRINDPRLGEEVLREGQADLVTMARALLADPDLPNKALQGKEELITHCVACNQGCFDRVFQFEPATCLVNPAAGIETELMVTPTPRKKKLLVIGGGPAGMKAAVTASDRGHHVVLVEKSSRLGGQILLNAKIPGREELLLAAEDLERNLRARPIEILLGKEIDEAFIRETGPDALVVATGATPLVPSIPGINHSKVVLAWDVLAGTARVGKKVIIVGGNAVGLETALYLASHGTISPEVLYFLMVNKAESPEMIEELLNRGDKQVCVVEMTKKVGQDLGNSTRWTVMAELKRLGVKIITGAKAIEVSDAGLKFQKDTREEVLSADSIVMATGSKSENALASL